MGYDCDVSLYHIVPHTAFIFFSLSLSLSMDLRRPRSNLPKREGHVEKMQRLQACRGPSLQDHNGRVRHWKFSFRV